MTERKLALVCQSRAALLCSGVEGEMCLLAYEQGSVAGCAAWVRVEPSWELSALPAKDVDDQTPVAVSPQAGENHGGAPQSQGLVLNPASCWLLCISPEASSSSL